MRDSIHVLLSDLDELRAWMLENGVYFARCGDLELRIDPQDINLGPTPTPSERVLTEEVDPEPRKDYDSAYEDPDLYLAVGGDPVSSTGKLPGER